MTRLLPLFAVIALGSGCATIFTGTTSTVHLDSEPPGAKMYVDGELRGTAPVSVDLSRSRDHRIKAKAYGYEPGEVTLRRDFNGVAILNTICVLCWGIDAVAGGLWWFDRDAVTVELEQGEAPPPPPPTPWPPAPASGGATESAPPAPRL